MSVVEWLKQLRKDPRGTFEEDLWIVLGGVAVILIGGLVAVAGLHRRGSNSTSPSPVLGTIVVVVGLVIVVFGLGLAFVNLTMWLRNRKGSKDQTVS